LIRVKPPGTHTIRGKTFTTETREFLPSDEDWGTHGWTFMSEPAARFKFASLL